MPVIQAGLAALRPMGRAVSRKIPRRPFKLSASRFSFGLGSIGQHDFGAQDWLSDPSPLLIWCGKTQIAHSEHAIQNAFCGNGQDVGTVDDGYRGEAACNGQLDLLLSTVRAASASSPMSIVAMQLSHLGDPALLERLSLCLAEMARHFRGALDFEAFARGWRKLFLVRGAHDLRELFDRMDTDCDGFVGYSDICSSLKPSEINALARRCPERGALFHAALKEEEMLLYRNLVDRARSALDLAQELGVQVAVEPERLEWQPAVDHIAFFLQRAYNSQERPVVIHIK